MSSIRQRVNRWLVALAWLPFLASAGELKVTVLDRDGNPVPNIAVWLEGAGAGAATGGTAVMDQVDTEFVPHILIVQTGTRVEFPNSDVIAHHVYSFSDPNDFMLPLYKGEAHDPVRFEHPGLVTLGCNIHDQMLAYILVVDTPEFAKTDGDGMAVLNTGPGVAGTVHIWSPRIRESGEILSLPASDGDLVFRIKGRLRRPHGGSSAGVEWSDY